MRSCLFRLPASLALVLLALSACGYGFVHTVQTPTPNDLPDTPPSILHVFVSVSVSGGVPWSNPRTFVNVQFLSHGEAISFHANETLACDGSPTLTLSDRLTHLGYPTSEVASRPFSCLYTSKGRSAQFAVLIPAAPEITSPAEGAHVPRAQATTITFTASSANAEIDAFSGPDTPPGDGIAQVIASGTASIDTSHFIAGPGLIRIEETPSARVIATGNFASVAAECSANTQVHVTWV